MRRVRQGAGEVVIRPGRQAREGRGAQRKADETRQQVITAWADRVAKAKAEMPDFDDMVTSSEVQVTDAVRDAILESEVGPRILYHLAEDPGETKNLATQPSYSDQKNVLRRQLEAWLVKTGYPQA
jgi:glucose-6-phosphate isomerase